MSEFSQLPPIAIGVVITSDIESDIFDCKEFSEALVKVVATAVTGTNPTLDINFQEQISAGNFETFENFPTIISVIPLGSAMLLKLNLTGIGHFRINFDVSGTTPSFTITMTIGMN